MTACNLQIIEGGNVLLTHTRCYKNLNLPSTSCHAKKYQKMKSLFCEKDTSWHAKKYQKIKSLFCEKDRYAHYILNATFRIFIEGFEKSFTMKGYFGRFLAKNAHDCPQNSQKLWKCYKISVHSNFSYTTPDKAKKLSNVAYER